MRPFLEPARRDVAALLAGLDGSPEAAWRLLASRGDIPASWLAHARRFIRDPGETRDPIRAPVSPHPTSLGDCARFAADVAGIEAAEAAAAQLVAALAPWGTAPFSHVRWWTISRGRYGAASTDTRPGVSYGLLFASIGLQNRAYRDDPNLPRRVFGHAAVWARTWGALAAAGATIPDGSNHLAGARFADLPDPFTPLAAIEAAGYATMEWVGLDGAIVLVAPTD